MDVRALATAQLPRFMPPYPSFATGLVVFMALLYLIEMASPGFTQANVVGRNTLLQLQIGGLSFYPMVHYSFVSLVIDIVTFYPLIRQFEADNGTVRCGIVLNVTAIIAGLAYSLLAVVLRLGDICGTGPWLFTLAGYYAWRESLKSPTIRLSPTLEIPTHSVAGLPLVLVLFSSFSYFLACVLGLGLGYAMGMGHLDRLFDPSTKVVEWIESKLKVGIDQIDRFFPFTGEVQAREIRQGGRTLDSLPR